MRRSRVATVVVVMPSGGTVPGMVGVHVVGNVLTEAWYL